ncbi:DEAD/DEAH box helicase [Streptomyces sp. NPDC020802]|uniref:DEAD/DEAH box helicase n=1 Tax=Streptomyces sp. NPDC020802 TaxID=3365094 RepID=UPI00379311F2
MTLPVALTGTDVIGQAKTGTGKTLGFGLPLLERVTVPADVEAGRAKPEQLTDAPQALVVVPTRELCTQVTNDLLTAGKVRNVRVLAIYGGRAYEPQVEALKKGVDVIVGTPGRLLDLAGQKKLDLKHIKSLVLDEADEMLDLGFLPDVERIINMLPARRQTMLFSATMPGAVIGLARRYMSQPTHINATSPDDAGQTVRNTKQFVYRAHNMDKPEMVSRILQADGRGLVMVFCRTKRTAADLADQLQQRGFASGAVHGDLGQGAREQALRAFRNGKVDVLVCTDVAARGIDVEGVTHVINYQSPEDEKTYLHRIGRTGRAGAKGIAITLVDWDDIPRWQLINKALDLGLSDPPETYSTSPHLYEELSIPAGTKGVLPRGERTRAGLSAEAVEDLGETGGRGPRGRGGRSTGPAPVAERERERPARTPRRRRRTRNGTALDAAEPQSAQAPQSTQDTTESAPAAESRSPRRRRRTRAGSGSEAAVTAVATAEGTAVEVAAVEATAPAAETAVDGEAKPRRRRTRRTAEVAQPEAAVVEEAPAAEPAQAAEVTEVTETKPRRRTRKAAETAVDTAEGTALEVAEVTETKPRRRTRKAAEAAVEAVVDPVEAVEAKPRRTRKATAPAAEAKPRRRTRKAAEAAPVAEAGIPAQATEEPEAKPRRRTRKAAETAVDTAEGTAVEVAEVTETKPRRRTRKAAETAVDTAEGTTAEAPQATATKPRRTRKAAAPAQAAESAVDTAEATEAKPRRTRKTAAKAAVAEAGIPAQATEAAPAEAPAKPRRTRKTAAKATDAVAVAEAVPAEAAPAARPRRARKTAATVEVADS